MNLKAVIIEDELNSREILRNYLAKYCPELTVLGEADSIQKGLKLLTDHNPDLLFLDVEMPYGNAFDLLDQLPDRNFETVFVENSCLVKAQPQRCPDRQEINDHAIRV